MADRHCRPRFTFIRKNPQRFWPVLHFDLAGGEVVSGDGPAAAEIGVPDGNCSLTYFLVCTKDIDGVGGVKDVVFQSLAVRQLRQCCLNIYHCPKQIEDHNNIAPSSETDGGGISSHFRFGGITYVNFRLRIKAI